MKKETSIEHLKHFLKEAVPFINTAIDKGLDENAYIVPGLGDAGDLAFGEKSF